MKAKNLIFFLTALMLAGCAGKGPDVTISSLLSEMTDLERLSVYTEPAYRTLQFSSYDRRSRNPSDTLWFANEDGFGGEPVPGYEAVLRLPDSTGTGDYLICDVEGPGVIQRLWTAVISGSLKVYLDSGDEPVYDGKAEDFFRKPFESLTGISDDLNLAGSFYQFDASYLPLPFAGRCRIVWTGSISEPHFYHVGLRLYKEGTRVEGFDVQKLKESLEEIKRTADLLSGNGTAGSAEADITDSARVVIGAGEGISLMKLEGPGAITFFSMLIKAEDPATALRQTMLRIVFDDATVPQVISPAGDFFSTGPGISPYESLPFSVLPDGRMVCRFIMPFKSGALITLENNSAQQIEVQAAVSRRPIEWEEGRTMHFYARFATDNGLTTSELDSRTKDLAYLMAEGSGRVAGAAAMIYNPSHVPTSWGNWWGEGDEKIYADSDTFPSFFGTGSEDYFNYSWSSDRVFSFPYCGQPLNDGPGNRGYVTNFRWHIADDIMFEKKIRFDMELRHHGTVTGFSYGRIVYFYGLPGIKVLTEAVSPANLPPPVYLPWKALAFKGSAGWSFIEAEKICTDPKAVSLLSGNRWSDMAILAWTPACREEKLAFRIWSSVELHNTRIGITAAHHGDAGSLAFTFNGKPARFDNSDSLRLFLPDRHQLKNHFSGPVDLKAGENLIEVSMPGADGSKKALIDFFWIRRN
ncbi:MAG: DUF2961 domain-containing protein [Bacteroidales bacterium]|jgi:hypothetical protein|nr:DUF2961 domain-containing protein [Bacteroidales bacterium]